MISVPINIRVVNYGKRHRKVKVLSGISLHNSNLDRPNNICIEAYQTDGISYKDIINYLATDTCTISFTESSNNRQMTFFYNNPDGSYKYFVPLQTERLLIKDGHKKIDRWSHKKWNIADTHEPVLWWQYSFIELSIKPGQEFIIKCLFLRKEHRLDLIESLYKKK